MKNTFTFIALFCIISMNCYAEIYCVETPAELQIALSDAASNSQSDLIKVAEGTYVSIHNGFYYWGANDFDLEISGGWSEFFKNPCGQQLSVEPFYSTIIDGFNNYQGLDLEIGLNANISISNLFFKNGAEVVKGGGVFINAPPNHTGNIVLSHNSFLNNTANFGSAIHASGDKLTLINNTFRNNHTGSGMAIELYSFDKTGIYFINNTVLSNTTDSSGPSTTAGLYISVTQGSKTLVANNIFNNNGTNELGFGGDGYKYLRNNNIAGTTSGVAADSDSGNFSDVPNFWSSVQLDYFIPYYGSPLINSGLQPPEIIPFPFPFLWDWTPPDFDIRNQTRIQENKIDIGAFEGINEPPIFKNGFE